MQLIRLLLQIKTAIVSMYSGAKYMAGSNILRLLIVGLFLFSAGFARAQEDFMHSHDEYNALPFATLKAASTYLQTDDRIDVLFYHISIEPIIAGENAKSIIGSVRIRFTPVEGNINAVRFNLRNTFTISSIESTHTINNWSHTDHLITLNFQANLNLGDTIEIIINYSGSPETPSNAPTKGFRFETHGSNIPVIYTANTPYLAHYWYPCKDGPSDKADSVRVDIIVPKNQYDNYPLIGVSNGLKIGEEDLGADKKKYIWLHRYPIVPYYVLIAISNYEEYIEKYANNGHEFPLIYYMYPEESDSSKKGVSIMPKAMDAFIHYFGDYPFKCEKYGMTRVPDVAIEKQTNAIMRSLAPTAQPTMVHELAHMWFGNSITNKSWQHIWLNEGFVTYAEALCARYLGNDETHDNEDAYADALNMYKNSMFNDTQTLFKSNDEDYGNLFVSFYYAKGAAVLHMLRGYINNDSVFFPMLKAYAQAPQFKYGYATTEDFRDFVEIYTGLELDKFFQQWIYEPGYIKYEYNYEVFTQDKLIGIQVDQVQGGGMPQVFEMYLEIMLQYKDNTSEIKRVFNNKRSQTFYFAINKEVSGILLDPDIWILRNNSRNDGLTVPNPSVSSWIGNASSDWNDFNNWDNGVPVMDAVVNQATHHPVIKEGDVVSVRKLILEPGAIIEQTGGSLTISDSLVIKSGPSLNSTFLKTAGALNIPVNQVKVTQHISSPTRSYMVSVPVSGATRGSSGITNNVFCYSNPTNLYMALQNTDEFIPGIGYFLRSDNNVVFSGNLNQGTYNISLERSTKGKGWNLVGNPYTHAINWNVIDKHNIDNSFWVYLNDQATYGVYNGSNGLAVTLTGPNAHIIPAHHAFWVRVTQGQTGGTITFKPDNRVISNNSYLKSEAGPLFPYLKLAADYNGNRDEMAVALVPEDIYDSNIHTSSEKFFSNNAAYSEIYSIRDNISWAIKSLPQTQTIELPIGISLTAPGSVEISMHEAELPENTTVVLIDKELFEYANLSSGEHYMATFENAGKHEHRFELIITKSESTSVGELPIIDQGSDRVSVHTIDNKISILVKDLNNPHYELFDISGRLIRGGKLNNNSLNTLNLNQKGVYILHISGAEGSFSFKVVL